MSTVVVGQSYSYLAADISKPLISRYISKKLEIEVKNSLCAEQTELEDSNTDLGALGSIVTSWREIVKKKEKKKKRRN